MEPGRAPTLIFAGVIAMAAVVALLIGLMFWQNYRDTLKNARTKVETSAQVVAANMEWLAGGSILLLQRLDKVFSVPNQNLSEATRQEFTEITKSFPAKVSAGLFDEQGKLVFTSNSDEKSFPQLPEADFMALKAGQKWFYSSLIIDPITHKQSFMIDYRLDRDGKFAGVAALDVPADVTSEMWDSLKLGVNSTVSVFRGDGWLVTRFPPVKAPLNLSNYVLFTDLLPKAGVGAYETVSPADGVTRLVGYRTIKNTPYVALAAVSLKEELKSFYGFELRILAILAPLLLGLIAMLWYLSKVLSRETAQRALLEKSDEQNKLLLREIHHRVKNNLQAVSSLVRLQPIPSELKIDMANRIASMTAIHEQAYKSDQYADVELEPYIVSLAKNIADSYPGDVKIETDLQPVTVDRDVALPLGLILNEVVSNALKHAFTEREAGSIKISLKQLDENKGELTIQDDGNGFTPAEEGIGMGAKLIKSFAAQIGDDFSYLNNNGTTFSMRFTLKQVA